MLNPKIIRRGDKVKILVPWLFVRCGYPKCLKSEVKVVEEEYRKDIVSLLEKVGGMKPCIVPGTTAKERVGIDKISREIAYLRLSQNGCGGNERMIHTKDVEEHLNAIVTVDDTKFCKTGRRVAPSYVHTMDGPDFEPGYLSNEKTHKILYFYPNQARLFSMGEDILAIEAKNVEKVLS